MNERGITLLETVLGMAILLLLAVTLLPAVNDLQGRLHNEKMAYRASEAAYNGVKEAFYTGAKQGRVMIEGMEYDWQYGSGEICVAYTDLEGLQRTCINSAGMKKDLRL